MAKVEELKRKRKLKSKSNDAKPASKPNAESGDVDDFADMLDTMKDYIPDDETNNGGDDAATTNEPSKKKRKKKAKGKQLSAMTFEASRQFAATITTCSPTEQAEWLFNDYTKHADQNDTGILAKEQSGLTESAILNLSYGKPLEQQLKEIEPNWRAELCGNTERPVGCPSVLIISPAAMGCVTVIKQLPELNKGCRVGKLFAKHFKVDEQIQALKSQVLCIGAGTPNRLCKLADEGALKMDKLKYILLDVGLDVKQRTILDIPEVRADVWLLYDKHIKSRVVDGRTRIGLFKL